MIMASTDIKILRFRLLLSKALRSLRDDNGDRLFSNKEVVDIAYGYKDEIITNYMNSETPESTALLIKMQIQH